MHLKTGLVALLMVAGAFSAATLTYHLTDLGTLPDGTYSVAAGVNVYGQVVGYGAKSPYGGHYHAFIYSSGIMQDLETLGGANSYATAINNLGQVVGRSDTTDGCSRAFMYSGVTMVDLGTLPGGDVATGSQSGANSINDLGQVVGWSAVSYPYFAERAFLYANGAMADLGSISNQLSEARDVNAAGVTVGWSSVWGNINGNAFSCSGGTMVSLGSIFYDDWSGATASNSVGQIVGSALVPYWPYHDKYHAFLYSGGVSIDLGTLGGYRSGALDINESGQIVGWAETEYKSGSRAFLYAGGAMIDLNGMLDASGTGWLLSEATGISDNGYICATARGLSLIPNETHAVLLTPNAGFTGTIDLLDFAEYGGDITTVPVEIEVRIPGTTTVVQRQMVKLSSSGSFTFITTLSGTFDIAVKASHWVRRKVTNVTLAGDSFISGVNFALENGDVDGDNVAGTDADAYAMEASGHDPSCPNWNPNADLNGDGTVGGFDSGALDEIEIFMNNEYVYGDD